jgi:hypothetical protein
MEEYDDYPQLGKNIQSWSELDSLQPNIDLDIELFLRYNVTIASFVILSFLLKSGKEQRDELFSRLTPSHFDPKSFARYLFGRLVVYLSENDHVSEEELERWVTDYFLVVWNVFSPKGRELYSVHNKLRLTLKLNPTKEQTYRAIELREKKMKDKGY